MIDEAKILAMGKGDPNGRDRILNVLATEGRKFGIGLILASQSSSHLGEDVKGNVGARLVLRSPDWSEVRKNALEIQVQPRDLESLRGKGEGFFRQGAGKAVKVQMSRAPKVSPMRDGEGY
jgi:DNA helicase HerA-like ATPase